MGKFQKILVLFISLLFTATINHAQIRHSYFNNYTIRDGLTDNIIHCIYQDSRGWMWLGSSFGLVRFDGYSFKKFDIGTQECDILSKSLVRTIIEDKNKDIWIGTENQGIFIYNRESCSLKQIMKRGKYTELCSNSIWSIVEDSEGFLWIATERGLNRFDPENKSFTEYTSTTQGEFRLKDDFVRVLRIDHNGNLWIGTNQGITLFDFKRNTSQHYFARTPTEKRENEIWEIFEDSKNQIWAGTYLGGMKRLNVVTNEFEEVVLEKNNERATTVRSIVQDKEGNYWVATRGGLYQMQARDQKVTHYEHIDLDDNSLGHNSVIKLIIDKKGDLWAGTRDGISYLNFSKQAFGNLPGGKNYGYTLNNSEIYLLWEGFDNDLWIGTESGGINIYNYTTNKVSYITREDGLTNNCIKAICNSQDGNLLIGTYLGGLNILDLKSGRIEHLLHSPYDTTSISSNDVWAILRDSRDLIWVGTASGLDLFDPKTKTFRHFGEKYNVSNVLMVYEDSRGRIWVYSENLKLTMIDTDGKIRDFPYASRAMCDDSDHNLWIGTLGNGLLKLDPETNETKIYTVDDGLCNNIIYGIINVENRYLWLSTINGISRFDMQKQEFKNYFHNDGLLNSQYNYGAFLKENDGTLVFGGGKGVDFIYLEKLDENRFEPPIVFTDFRVFNEQVPLKPGENEVNTLSNLISETKQIVLDYDQNMLSFEFAALNYANSNKNEYQYKLEGFDRGWNKIGNERRATYTNLDPGEYTLRVIGSNNDGLYNMEGATMSVIILPPYWKTWWFKLIILLILILLCFAVYVVISNREKLKSQLLFERQSTRKMQELDRLKHQFFMNISHEIRTPLSLISGPVEKLLQLESEHSERKSLLEIIQRNTLNLKKLINQLLDYRKLETGNIKLQLKQGNISRFISEIYQSFTSLAIERKIDFTFKSIAENIESYFDPDIIEKALNNLLSNAFKYTQEGGKIDLTVSLIFADDIDENKNYKPAFDKELLTYKQYLQIVVHDNGIGIPGEQQDKIFNRFIQLNHDVVSRRGGTGIGLSLAKELVKIHDGHIRVKSKENKGSRFTILIPFIEENPELIKADDNPPVSDMHETTDIPQQDRSLPKVDSHQPLLLIVEDNPDIRLFIKHHFEPEYFLYEARNGKEGWDKTLEVIPDAIIADIMMPEMDGKEFCRKVKRDERTSHIPIIILTALSSPENQKAGIDAGADDYVTKPFDVSLLKARIDNILSIRKSLRERYSREMILKPRDIILASPDEKFLKRIIATIEKNMDNIELDVDTLAQQMCVSRTQLYRKIAALTDMTPKEFVRDIRLERAAQFILQEKLTINEIALRTGFNDISYFRKCFKDKFGMSASDFMKKGSIEEKEIK